MTTYGEYLCVDELLSLQKLRSEPNEHDELLFIVVHQVYELWFKTILHELDGVGAHLERGRSAEAAHGFKRSRTILKTLVSQLDIIETMTPLGFLSFRDRLESSSGFQSAQFRELEFTLGKKSEAGFKRFPDGSDERRRLEERYNSPTLWDRFLSYIGTQGYSIPGSAKDRDVTQTLTPSPDVQKILLQAYRENSTATQICELMVDLDEGVQEWRYRHVKMVERTIGMKMGTGGSEGVAYLRNTLFQPAFPDLWEIRGAF